MTIHPHSSLEALAQALAAETARLKAQAEADPFQPIPVISPSKQFTDWIQVEIARQHGLCMGLEFLAIGGFLEKVTEQASAWSPQAMTWRILPEVAHYAEQLGMKDPSIRDQLALARLIADQLDLYAHYRPELIQDWHHGRSPKISARGRRQEALETHQAWQRELWGKIAVEPDHPLLAWIDRDPALCPPEIRSICSRLFVVGVGSIDPLLVKFLKSLPEECEVQVHVCLPSLEYLGDLKRRIPKDRDPSIAEEDPESFEPHPGHPLLVSMGRKSIGAFHLLGELDPNYAKWPEPGVEEEAAEPQSLLNQIQRDIHLLKDINAFRHPSPPEEAADDRSLSVHSCFGPRREMEVLRDELLRAFKDFEESEQPLEPDEVLIVTPSLETYGPLVAAVIEQVADAAGAPLSVRLTQLPPSEQSPVAEGILALLKMAHRDVYEASSLIELLQLRAVRGCFGITDSPEEMETLRDWVAESGLTRKLGETPSQPELGCWQFAADRLIAGAWLGPEECAKYPGVASEEASLFGFVLPLAEDLRGNRVLRQKMVSWMACLAEIYNEWRTPAPPKEWSARLAEAALRLLMESADEDAEDVHLEIQRQLDFLAGLSCEEAVDAGAMLDWLAQEFEQSGKRSPLTGQIAFGEFKHLQHIPCRVLAMVGMQEGAFPRPNRMPAWSLLRLSPKVWDRNARIDDRQLFLDAVLTPTDRLIITASTRNVRSGKTEPFSVCVDELLRVAEAMGRNRLVVEHRLQPFAAGYFGAPASAEDAELPMSFDARNCAVAVALASHDQASRKGIPFWDNAVVATSRCDVGEGLPHWTLRDPELVHFPDVAPRRRYIITLDELAAFWKDPAKGYLRAQGIQTYEEDDNDEDLDQTPLALGGLQKWAVKDAVFNAGLNGGQDADIAFAKAHLLAGRGLPPGKLGEDIWAQLEGEAAPIAQQVKELTADHPPLAIAPSVALGDLEITVPGSLRAGNENGQPVLVAYHIGKFEKARHYLKPWIEAVAAAAVGKALPSILIHEREPKQLDPIAPEEARLLLAHLVRGYLESRTRPLCYAPLSSEAYVKRAIKVEEGEPARTLVDLEELDRELALETAAKAWHAPSFNGSPAGEGVSRNSQLAWRDVDPFEAAGLKQEWHEWALRIAEPLHEWTKGEGEPIETGNGPSWGSALPGEAE